MAAPTKVKVVLQTRIRIMLAVITLLGFIEVAFVAFPGNISNIKKSFVSKTANQAPQVTSLQYDPLTSDLIARTDEYSKLSSKKKKLIVPQLKEISQQRKEFLSSLLKTDPAMASKFLLSEKQRIKMPKSVQLLMEKPVSISGEFVRLHAEEFDPVTEELIADEEKYFIKQKKSLTPVYFAAEPQGFKTGDRVKGSGIKLGNDILISSPQNLKKKKISLVDYTKNLINKFIHTEKAFAHSGTEKKTAVILVNFQNAPEEPYTPEQARAAVFTNPDSVNAFYRENSFGHMSLVGHFDAENGDVFGWYTLPYNVGCDDNPAIYENEIEAVAARNGYNSSNYDNVIIGLSTVIPGCERVAGFSGDGKRAYILSTSFPVGTVVHEIGHNMGLGHAKSYWCTDAQNNPVILSDTCTVGEYGDGFSVMGHSSNKKHFNNAQKQTLGWFHDNNILNVTESGVYRIAPIEINSDQVQLLRIPKERDAQGNVTAYFTFEFRQPFGFDNFPVNAPAVTGVTAHIARQEQEGGGWLTTYLLDSMPATGYQDAPFQVGSIFREPSSWFTMQVVRVTPEFAEVSIEISNVQPRLVITKGTSRYNVSDALEDVTITSEPAGINCGRICSAQFPEGTNVQLTARPNEYVSNYTWSSPGWFIMDQLQLPVVMNSEKVINLSFNRGYRRGRDGFIRIFDSVSGGAQGNTIGELSFSPPGQEMLWYQGDSRMYGPYSIGTNLHADVVNRISRGYVFQGWTGACNTQNQQCAFQVQDDSVNRHANSITAVFEKQPYLSLSFSGNGHGGIVSSPEGVNCSAFGCSGFFPEGTTVTLQANPAQGSSFVGWQDFAECGQEPVCQVTVGGNGLRIRAQFSLGFNFSNVSVFKRGDGSGTIVSNPSGIDCGAICSAAFERVLDPVLSARPDSESVFLGWGELSNCTNGFQGYECQLNMQEGSRQATANFGQRFFCTDSDNGDNLATRGSVRTEDQLTGETHEYQDTCHDNYIWEYTCSADNLEWVNASETCPESFICSDGACVPSNLGLNIARNPQSPSSLKPGQNVWLASFDVTNPNDQEAVINEVSIQMNSDALARFHTENISLRLGNTFFSARVDRTSLVFSTPVSQHVAPHSTETISFYLPIADDSLVNSFLELTLVSMNTSAHLLNGLPISTGHLIVEPERVLGVADPIFYSEGLDTRIEVTTNTLRFIVMNDGELQFPTFLYYAVEWLDAQGTVLRRDEQQGNTMLRPGGIEGLYFSIPRELNPVSARITLDSFNVAAEGEAGEANNVRIVSL